ncbi:hypothetical protein STRCI_001278 [Streptomyces cinnabarinus]|uniref:Uncharacterized protein n=1 Tax=Streptomyces cinnabarinus TaxID=67287 RepID=A0ABY7KB68_9ACTN|nr:hypothetical protein [Streptomyces cinnabarinus]WAZ20179.1 hypothetical protein STRCI_001278 [Streptomyces cinnabarinus]
MGGPHLTLRSSSLLSKWGFNDGDDPEDWLDYCEANGIDYTNLDFPLIPIVRRYLLPKLDQSVEVVELETCHNPIRAETVDGQDVTEVWFGRAPEPTLTPESVDVPMADVLRLALAEAA